MSTFSNFLKKPLLHGVLIGAFGGMAPKIIEMIPKLFNNIFPSSGHLLALALLALIGGIIVLVYKEENLQKALILGAGAPALLATLTAQAVAPSQTQMLLPFNVSIVATAYAQLAEVSKPIKFVFQQNESPYSLNRLWIRADNTTIKKYTVQNDTLVVTLPVGTKEVRIDLPEQGQPFLIPVSELLTSTTVKLKIVSDQQTKDFWETFGNKNIPKYKIEKIK
jgi:hypothetical protein